MKRKKEGWLTAVLWGTGVSALVTVLAILMCTELIMRNWIGEGSIGVLLPVVSAVALLIGGYVGFSVTGSGKPLVPLVVLGVYLCIMIVCGLLFWEGSFQNLWVHLLVLLTGSGISCVLCFRKTGRARKRNRRFW